MFVSVNYPPCVIKIGKHLFNIDFDLKSIDILQTLSGTGFYKIYQDFVFSDNLNCLPLILTVGVYKFHGAFGIQKIKNILKKNPKISTDDLAALKILFKNLLPDQNILFEEMKNINGNFSPQQNSSDFCNFQDYYALAKYELLWSESDFWNSTPKKLFFSVTASLKYKKQKNDIIQKHCSENGLSVLKGIKNIL